MQIGPYTLNNNLIVAPMAGVTDRPFRQLCKSMGAGMAVSEMVSSNSLLWGSERPSAVLIIRVKLIRYRCRLRVQTL